jgi:hypothetical protein
MYPMTTTTTVGLLPAPKPQEASTAAVSTNGAMKVKLIHEALSRVRMRRPQAVLPSSEAYRPARQIAMQALHRAAREQGLY